MKKLIKFIREESEIYKTGVYKLYYLTNPDLFYIGSTAIHEGRIGKIGFHRRLSGHLQFLKKGRHHSKILQHIFNTQGTEGLIMEILAICDPSECKTSEQVYIDNLKPPCNTHISSTSGIGTKHTAEAKHKISLAHKGRKITEDHKRKISQANKGKMPKNILHFLSPEVKLKAALARRGIRKTSIKFFEAVRSPVIMISVAGEVIKEYSSIRAAVCETGIASSSISQCATGRRKTAGGYSWKYKAVENGHLISPHIHQKEK